MITVRLQGPFYKPEHFTLHGQEIGANHSTFAPLRDCDFHFLEECNLVIARNAFLLPHATRRMARADADMKTVFYPYPVVDIHLFIAFVEILHFDVAVHQESKSPVSIPVSE